MWFFVTWLSVVLLMCTIHYTTSTDDQHDEETNWDKGLLFDAFPGSILSFPNDSKHIKQSTTQVRDKMDCIFACVGIPWCRSINFKTTAQENGLHVCELISTDKHTHPKNMTQNNTFIHFSIKNPCLNGVNCIFLSNRQDYECKKGFYGDNCQNVLRKNCLEHYNAGKRQNGVYTVGSDSTGTFQVYCDMTTDGGGWTLIARFSNSDTKNWMRHDGQWWYDVMTAQGNITSTSVNQDMISPAFWSVTGSEIKITRSDDSSHTALLRTTSNCLRSLTFRAMITSYGNFRNGVVWASNRCLGSCNVVYGGQYLSTHGFSKAQCNGNIQSSNKIGFWCDYDTGDGSVMMIGGGGSACARADHGIGITEENAAKFGTSMGCGFGENGSRYCQSLPYGLNLWIK